MKLFIVILCFISIYSSALYAGNLEEQPNLAINLSNSKDYIICEKKCGKLPTVNHSFVDEVKKDPGHIKLEEWHSCMSMCEKNKTNLNQKEVAKNYCEEVFETYVICNGNRYELTSSTTSSLLRQTNKIEEKINNSVPSSESAGTSK